MQNELMVNVFIQHVHISLRVIPAAKPIVN